MSRMLLALCDYWLCALLQSEIIESVLCFHLHNYYHDAECTAEVALSSSEFVHV